MFVSRVNTTDSLLLSKHPLAPPPPTGIPETSTAKLRRPPPLRHTVRTRAPRRKPLLLGLVVELRQPEAAVLGIGT